MSEVRAPLDRGVRLHQVPRLRHQGPKSRCRPGAGRGQGQGGVEEGRHQVEQGWDLDVGAELAGCRREHCEVALDLLRVCVSAAAPRDNLDDLSLKLWLGDVISDREQLFLFLALIMVIQFL